MKIFKRFLLMTFPIWFVPAILDAQPDIHWEKMWGESGNDVVYDSYQTADGGFIMAGYTNSFGSTSYDILVIKTDKDGNEEWISTFGGSENDFGRYVHQKEDGSYIIAGYTYSNTAGSADGFMAAVSVDGDSLWLKNYGGTVLDVFYGGVDLDEGYAFTGYKNTGGLEDIWVVQVDDTGKVAWDKVYDNSSYDRAYAIDRTLDGNGVVVSGRTYVSSSYEVYVMKIVSDGTSVEFEYVFGSSSYTDEGWDIVATKDGGYVVAGLYGASPGYDYLAKLNPDGSLAWHNIYTSNTRIYGVTETADSNYVMVGRYYTGSQYEFYAVKVHNNSPQWIKSFGGSGTDVILDVVATNDRGLAFSGYSTSNSAGGNDAWLGKIDGDFLDLQTLYESTDGDNWTDNTNWLSDKPYSEWYGLSAAYDQITGINLEKNGLNGTIPGQIAGMYELLNLNLSRNAIDGELPANIDTLKKIQRIVIDSTDMGGALPPALAEITTLTELELVNSQFQGSIPTSYGNFPNITKMRIAGNNISAGIPKSLGNLTTLDTLDLSDNNLSGNIPVEIGDLTNTRSLNLSGNNLDGAIPPELGNMTNIVELYLEGNQLEEVPPELEDLANLDRISIANNQITDLPNLSVINWTSEFHVENNMLTFEDLVPNSGITGFVYAPQDSVETKQEVLVSTGDEINLSALADHVDNEYQWFKDGSSISGATSSTFTIPAATLEDAGVYSYEITNTSAGDLTLVSRPKMVEVYSTQYTLERTFSFPEKGGASSYEATDYRLIGLPGAGMTPIGDVFTGSQGSDWQAYWDNGDPSNDPKDYLVKADGSSTFQFRTGRAFWIINKGSVDLSEVTVNTAPLDGDLNATLPLDHAGWNLITNPFDVPVPWSSVQAENGISQPLWSYSGSSASTMQPYTGYYFDNSDEMSSLKIPYPGAGKVSTSPLAKEEAPGWQIQVVLESDEWVDSSAALGVAPSAEQELDRYDFRKPRIVANTPSVYFEHADWSDSYPIYATDIRASHQAGYSWDMTVSSPEAEQMSLTFNGISAVPGQQPILLLDKNRNETVDLRKDSVYTFVSRGEAELFRVLVGADATEYENSSQLVPDQFALENNYPNPFSPSSAAYSSTTIPVAIPENTELVVEIYNLSGQYVRTLFDGPAQPGYEYLQWDGKDASGQSVASGVYLCRMETRSGEHRSLKILLMK